MLTRHLVLNNPVFLMWTQTKPFPLERYRTRRNAALLLNAAVLALMLVMLLVG